MSATTTEPKRRILVVDDDRLVLRAIARELSKGFEVVKASSYIEAVERLEQEPDLVAVVSDGALGPGPSGIDLLTAVRSINPDLVRVLASGSMAPENVSVDDGLIDRFMAKPWRGGELLAMLESLLEADTSG